MKRSSLFAFGVTLALASGAGLAGAQAQATDIGKYEFETYCAVCHGKDAKGGGPFSMLLTKKVPDLSVLSKANNGVFPFARAYEVIDGTTEIAGHGNREMPVWGDHYLQKVPGQLGPLYSPTDSASFVRGRILALVGYLSTLQQK